MNAVQKTLKDNAAMRWFVLILISAIMFATYWSQDFFSGLKGLMETTMDINSDEFGRLLGFTTIANMFGMIIVGGIILDKWGIKLAMIVFGALAVLGTFVTYLGAAGFFGEDPSTKMVVMVIGRIMFGSGLEVVCVIVTRTVIKWFKGYELALALAINMGFGRLGSALGTSLSIDIAQGSVPTAIGFASTLVGLGFILFLIYFVFDLKLDKQLNEQTEKIADEQFKFSDLVKLITNKSFLYIALLCVAFYSAVFPFMQYAPDLLVNKYGFGYLIPESAEVFKIFGSEMLGTISIYLGLFVFGLTFSMVPSKMKTRRNQVLSVTIILALFSLFIYSLWDSTLSVWLENGPKTASLIPLGTILFTPIFGNFVDKKGKAASLMILGACLLIFAHLSLSIFDSKLLGYAGLVSLGIAFSLVPAAMWPSVAKIVAENRLGTAYASMFTIQNWGLGIFFWGIGAVLNIFNSETVEQIASIKEGFVAQGLTNVQIGEKMIELKAAGEIPAYDYTNPILMLVVLGCISIVLAFLLKKADKEQGYGLEKPNIVE